MLTDTRKRWFLLAFLWTVIMLIGISGFVKQGSADDVNRAFLDNLYLTLADATLEGVLSRRRIGEPAAARGAGFVSRDD